LPPREVTGRGSVRGGFFGLTVFLKSKRQDVKSRAKPWASRVTEAAPTCQRRCVRAQGRPARPPAQLSTRWRRCEEAPGVRAASCSKPGPGGTPRRGGGGGRAGADRPGRRVGHSERGPSNRAAEANRRRAGRLIARRSWCWAPGPVRPPPRCCAASGTPSQRRIGPVTPVHSPPATPSGRPETADTAPWERERASKNTLNRGRERQRVVSELARPLLFRPSFPYESPGLCRVRRECRLVRVTAGERRAPAEVTE